MIRATILLLCILIWNQSLFAQAPTIQWQSCLGGNFGDQANYVQQTSDGGYIVTGFTESSNNGDVGENHGNQDIWVIKLGAANTIQWQRCLGGSSTDVPSSIRQTTDGGYIMAGYTNSNDGDVSGKHGGTGGSPDIWVVKLSSVGVIQWQRCLGGTQGEGASSIEQTSDGNYILLGYAGSNNGDVSGNHGGGENDIWIVKLSGTGALLSQRCLGGSSQDFSTSPQSLQITTDGGCIISGYTYSNDGDVSGNHGGGDMWIVKLSNTNAIEWQRCLGGTEEEGTTGSVRQIADGSYVVYGYTASNNGDVSGNHGAKDLWIIKLSSAGVIQWQRCLGGTGDEDPGSIQQTTDGSYIICGYTASNNGDVSGNHGAKDMWVVKLNSTGIIQWQRCLGGSGYEGGGGNVIANNFIQQTNDGGYIMVGYTGSNDGDVSGNHGGWDMWVVKLNSLQPPLLVQHFHQLTKNTAFSSRTQLAIGSNKSTFSVCADGSKASVFKFSGGAQDYSQLIGKISGTDISQIGSFSLISQSRDSLILLYKHPDYIQTSASSTTLSAGIYTNPGSSTALISFNIIIFRAPVLMVHGLWSDASAYKATKVAFINTGWYNNSSIKVADYHKDSHRSFIINSPKIPGQIDTLIKQLQIIGIAAGKVDYIGHSMGGILGRLYLQNNTYRDDVHKIITVNTPHSGSQLANLLRSVEFPKTNDYACSLINKFLGPFENGACEGGAVDDLKVNSIAIRNDLNGPSITNNKVPAHAIVTYDNIQLDGFAKRSKSALFDLIFSLYNTDASTAFQAANDVVVSTISQRGGLDGDCNTFISNQLHIGSVENPQVINRLIALLSSPTNISFCSNGFSPTTLEPTVTSKDAQIANVATIPSIHINSPNLGQYIALGQLVNISIIGKNIIGIKTIIDYSPDTVYAAHTSANQTNYSFTPNSQFTGRKSIIALGLSSDGNYVSDTSYFYISNLPAADLTLTLSTSTRTVRINDPVTYTVRLRNQSNNPVSDQISAFWENPLPPNLQFVYGNNVVNVNGIIKGRVINLPGGQEAIFEYQLKPLVAGIFQNSAQIISTSNPDTDSRPGSGLADGEDDTSTTDFRTVEYSNTNYTSPNPNQLPLPDVLDNQPPVDPTNADLSLRMQVSNLSAKVNDIITYTLTVSNRGGMVASGVQLSNQLSNGLEFLSGDGWSSNGSSLTGNIGQVDIGASTSIIFQARVAGIGNLNCQAQISASSVLDPDSTPNNGFVNGEDDTAQISIRVH